MGTPFHLTCSGGALGGSPRGLSTEKYKTFQGVPNPSLRSACGALAAGFGRGWVGLGA